MKYKNKKCKNKKRCSSPAWKSCGSGKKSDNCNYKCPKTYIINCLNHNLLNFPINIKTNIACLKLGDSNQTCEKLTFKNIESKFSQYKVPKKYKTKKNNFACIYENNECKSKK